MKCPTPVWIQDKTTGGTMYVPCGRCISCRLNRARMWSIRIMHETKSYPSSIFVTLTYNDEHLPKNGSLVKRDIQLFMKRLRKSIDFKVRYFIGGEYGDVGNRPHYHAILFGLAPTDQPTIERAWGKGFVSIGTVTHDSANYVACYTLKKLSGSRADSYRLRGIEPEFALMSTMPGIGSEYLKTYASFLKQNNHVIVKGKPTALPRYYSDRIFDETERAIIRVIRQEEYDEKFEKTRQMADVVEDFEVADYQRGQRAQIKADLEAKNKQRRRKL